MTGQERNERACDLWRLQQNKMQTQISKLACLVAMAAPLTTILLCEPNSLADPKKGKDLFQRRCTGCHRLDEIRSGPRLRGVVGRAAGADPGYPYSQALKSSKLIWDDATLDQWLTDPQALVPDNDMPFRVANPDERAGIIAY